jgi:Rap1a immunity proteins
MRFARRRAPRTPALRIDQSRRSHRFRALPAQPSLAEETAAAWRGPAHFSSEVARSHKLLTLALAAWLIIPAHGGICWVEHAEKFWLGCGAVGLVRQLLLGSGDTTKDLIEECRQADLLDPDKAPQNSTMVEGTLGLECLSCFDGFVAGYGETTMAFGAKELICLPAGTDVFQVVAAYVKWGDHNREKGHLPPRTTAMMAMREAFPCK